MFYFQSLESEVGLCIGSRMAEEYEVQPVNKTYNTIEPKVGVGRQNQFWIFWFLRARLTSGAAG